jgi:probable F420-dependent oxidoreductase
MKYGVIFPTTEIGTGPSAVRDYAQAAEKLGYAVIGTYDHVLGAVPEGRGVPFLGPYTHMHPFREALTLLSFIAACTSRIRLMTAVLILPARQAVLVAKQASEISILSEGRFVLGIGTGWNFVEYAALGMSYNNRVPRLDEQVEILRLLWTKPIVSYHGAYHRLDRVSLLPKPGELIPMWFGGTTVASFERACSIGQGFIFPGPPSRFVTSARTLADMVRDRGIVGFEIGAMIDFAAGRDAWRSEAELWAESGGTVLSLRTMEVNAQTMGLPFVGFAAVSEHISALEVFMNEMKALE